MGTRCCPHRGDERAAGARGREKKIRILRNLNHQFVFHISSRRDKMSLKALFFSHDLLRNRQLMTTMLLYSWPNTNRSNAQVSRFGSPLFFSFFFARDGVETLSKPRPGFQEQTGVSFLRLRPVNNVSSRRGMQQGNHRLRQTGRGVSLGVEQQRGKTVGKALRDEEREHNV